MANNEKPNFYLDWTNGLPGQIAKPPLALSSAGWSPGQPIPAQFLNYLFWLTDQWIQFFDGSLNATVMAATLDTTQRLIGGGDWHYNAVTGLLTWSEDFQISVASIADADNNCAAGSVSVEPGQLLYVQANIPFTAACDLTSGSAELTNVGYSEGIGQGMAVSGPGIAPNTIVITTSGTSVTLNNPVTASAEQQPTTFSAFGALSVKAADVASLIPSQNTVVIGRVVADALYLGVNSGQMRLADGEQKRLLASGYLHTSVAQAGQSIAVGQPIYISPGLGDTDNTTGTTSAGSAVISAVASTANIVYGCAISGANIPSGTSVVATTTNSITLSNAATSSASNVSIVTTRIAGAAYLADASKLYGSIRSNVVGLVITSPSLSPSAPTTLHYMTGGLYSGIGNLQAGAIYYVDPVTPGALTSTRPSSVYYTASVGVALSASSLYVRLHAAASLPRADSVFNDIYLSPQPGDTNAVQLVLTDSSGAVKFVLDAAGNVTTKGNLIGATLSNSGATGFIDASGNLVGTSLQTAQGSPLAPSQTFSGDTTTGSYLDTLSATKGVLAWAVNKVRLLALNASGLFSSVPVNAPSYVSGNGFKAFLEAGLFYASNDAAGNPNAPTTFTNLLQPILGTNGPSNMKAIFLPAHGGSVVACAVYLNDPIAAQGYTFSIQVIINNGASGQITWNALSNASGSTSVAVAKGQNYFLSNGSSVYALIKFSSASAATRARVVLTLEMDG